MTLGGAYPTAQAIEWQIEGGTEFGGYQHLDVAGNLQSRLPFGASFRVDAVGIPVAGDIGFHALLRYRNDFGLVNRDQFMYDNRIEILYGWLDWRSANKRVSLKGGRQYLFDLHRFEAVDGMEAEFALPMNLKIGILAGNPVTARDPLAAGVNTLDGPDEGGMNYGTLIQARLQFQWLERTHLRLTYRNQFTFQSWQHALGFGASHSAGPLRLAGGITIDLLTKRVRGADAQVYARLTPNSALGIRYSLVTPDFGVTAIAWAFSFKPYHEWVMRGNTMLGPIEYGVVSRIALLTNGTLDGNGESIADLKGNDAATEVQMSWRLIRKQSRYGVAFQFDDGGGGLLVGPGLSVGIRNPKWLDLDFTVLALYNQDDIQPGLTGWVLSVDARGTVRIGETARVRVVLSNYTTPFTPLQLRGRLEAVGRFAGGRS